MNRIPFFSLVSTPRCLPQRAGAVLVVLCATVCPASAQITSKDKDPRRVETAATAPNSQDAQSILRRVRQTLNAAQTLTAEFTASSEYPTFYRDSLEKGKVTLAKPGKAAIHLDRYRKLTAKSGWQAMGNRWSSVSDSTDWGTLIQHPDSAQHRQAAAPASPEKLLENIEALQGFFFGQEADASEARALGQRIWEGQKYAVIETPLADGGRAQVFVGSDGLIHRYLAQTTVFGKIVRREVTLHNIRLDVPIEAQTFVLAVPAESQLMERIAAGKTLAVGDDAPDFTVQDASGKPVRLSDFKGQTVVLKFFATWCGSCRQSLPHTQAVTAKYEKRNVVSLAVDIWDSPKALKKWREKQGAKYAALRFAVDSAPQGKDIATRLYGVRTTPTIFVIAPTGKIAAVMAGYEGPSPDLEEAVTKALAP